MFGRFKSSGNQTEYNRKKPGNRYGILIWARDQSVDMYEIDLCRSSEMDHADQYMLRVFFVLHNFDLIISDRSIPLDRTHYLLYFKITILRALLPF